MSQTVLFIEQDNDTIISQVNTSSVSQSAKSTTKFLIRRS